MSRACNEKTNCQDCQLTPYSLHIKANITSNKAKHKQRTSDDGEGHSVVSGCIDAEARNCSATGAGNIDSILTVVAVQVKAKKGNKVVTAYAFLDPDSDASFCTEKLMAAPHRRAECCDNNARLDR